MSFPWCETLRMIDREFLCLLLLITFHLATLNDPCGRKNSTNIHIIGFFPCTDPNDTRGIPVDNCDGIERIPIMKLALEEINERCDLLPGYRLVVDYANSAVRLIKLHSNMCKEYILCCSAHRCQQCIILSD